MRKLLATIVGLISSICGCNSTDSTSQTAVAVQSGDRAMAEATQKAKESLATFRTALSNPKPTQEDLSVKVPIQDQGATHEVWLQMVRQDGDNFIGVLGSDVAGFKSCQVGQEVSVNESEVSDWMFVEDGKLVGGYTLRAIREQLRGQAREGFEKSMWFKFE